jgi:predicted AlkP superfamily phosphohydrolase/phosphomutase
MPETPRVIVFGIDGGTWDLMLPLIKAGKLPAVKRLRDLGMYGQLKSTFPYSSFPAWTTAITGVNPGRHGITDFTRRCSGQDKLIFLNSRHRSLPTVFDILSQRRRRVASLGIPATSPPDPINGVMIGGFDCPVAVSAHKSMVHPPQLGRVLYRKFGEYPYGSISEFRITPGWYARARKVLLDNIDKRQDIFHWLWRQNRWDLFWMVFPETDTAQHHFWNLHDPDSPRHDPQLAAQFGDTIVQIYQCIDRVLQSFLDVLSGRDTLIVMSDHGFGGAGSTVIYLNLWLAQQGYLKFKSGRRAAKSRRDLVDYLLSNLPDRLPQWLFRKGSRWMGSLESRRRFSGIDWSNTTAFSEESNSLPGIWCRLQGRDPKGTVASSQRKQLLEDIHRKLLSWRCPWTGHPVIKQVHRREEIFSGPYVPMIPDLILEPAFIDGYSQSIGNSRRAATDQPIQCLPRKRQQGGKGSGFSGTHRRHGVFIAHGAGVKGGPVSEIDIVNIAPTILYHLNETIPDWMEGSPVIQPAPEYSEVAA